MSDPVEYPQGSDFPGVIGRTVDESTPAWPAPIRAHEGAPNVLFVVLVAQGTGEPDIANGKGAPGRGQLYIDGRLVANTDYPHTTPLFVELEGLSCGFDFGAPVSETYAPRFPFTGTIRPVAVDLAGDLIADDEAELRLMMSRQ